MAIQINPAGSSPVPSAAASQTSVAAPRSTPMRALGVTVPPAGSQAAAVAQVNEHLQQTQTDLKLQVDAGSGRTVFQIVQQGTGEVVLQVPSAEVLGMSARMRDLEGQLGASGALVDKQS